MLSKPISLLLLWVVQCLSNDAFTAKVGIMVRLHGTDGAILGSTRDEAAGAAIMAIKHIRSRNSSLVPEATTLHSKFAIEFELVDTYSDPPVGVQHAVAFNDQGVDMIVGAARSAVSGPVSLVAGLTETPVVSYSSTAAVLGTSTYPMFSRVIPNDGLTAFSFIMVCKEFGWSQIALIFIDDSYGQGYAQSVQNFAAQSGVNILVAPSFTTGEQDSISGAVKGVRESGARVVFCIAFAQDMEAIAVASTEQGIVGKGYVWLTGDGVKNPAGVLDAAEHPEVVLDFLVGFLTINTKPLYGEKGELFGAVWQHEKTMIDLAPLNAAAGDYIVEALQGGCSDMCGYIYDAVWAAALAINAAVDYETLTMDKSQLNSHLRAQEFRGSTGTVSFNPSTGDRAAGGISVIYQNWVPAGDGKSIEVVDLYEWDADRGVLPLGPTPVWGGGVRMETAPPDGSCSNGFFYSAETLSCVPCAAGSYEIGGGCVACEVGKVAPSPGSAACVQCESGYADQPGMTGCLACPEHSARDSSSSGVSRAECLCRAGYYSEVPGGNCSLCVPGAVCPGDGALPEPRYGFWGQRDCQQLGGEMDCGDRWLDFKECSVASMCPGGETFECADGHEGRQCVAAAPGWFKVGGNFHFECGRYGVLVSLVLIGLVVLMWYLLNKIASSHYDALDIALLFVQSVGMISSYGFKWHSSVEYLNLALSIANFDVDFVTPLCIMEWSPGYSFFLQLMLPLIFAGLKVLKMCIQHLVAVVRGERDEGWVQRCSDCAKRRFLAASVMLYHTLCLRCFEVFRCEAYPDGQQYMVFAPQTQCWTPMHKAMLGVSILYVIVIIVGTPLVLILVVRWYKVRNLLHCPVAMKQWGFVHSRYEAEWKYWESMLVLRRGMIACLHVFVDSPMIKGAFTMVGLTALLSAHVFTKPYVDSQIDILDFASIVGTIFYCLAGILSYPSITARTRGVVCTEGGENPPECAAELNVKFSIAVTTWCVVAVTLGVSVFLAWVNVQEKRKSNRAAAIVHKYVVQRAGTLCEVKDTANKVSLAEMLDGRVLLPWARTLHMRRASSLHASFRDLGALVRSRSSYRGSAESSNGSSHGGYAELPASAKAFVDLEHAVRAVPVDLTQYSAEPVAHVMRKLTEIHGLCDWLSCASTEAKAGLRSFVEEFVDFLSVVEAKHDDGAFALSGIIREEYRPLAAFWLMRSTDEEMLTFWKLITNVLESDPKRHDPLRNMSSQSFERIDTALQTRPAQRTPSDERSQRSIPHPWLAKKQTELVELWRHLPDHATSIRLGQLRRASLPLVESRKNSSESLGLSSKPLLGPHSPCSPTRSVRHNANRSSAGDDVSPLTSSSLRSRPPALSPDRPLAAADGDICSWVSESELPPEDRCRLSRQIPSTPHLLNNGHNSFKSDSTAPHNDNEPGPCSLLAFGPSSRSLAGGAPSPAAPGVLASLEFPAHLPAAPAPALLEPDLALGPLGQPPPPSPVHYPGMHGGDAEAFPDLELQDTGGSVEALA